MNKRNRILLMASGGLAVAAVVLTCGPALARYMETWTEDQGFQAKPLEPLKINKSIQQLDGEYVIKFTAGSAADRALYRFWGDLPPPAHRSAAESPAPFCRLDSDR